MVSGRHGLTECLPEDRAAASRAFAARVGNPGDAGARNGYPRLSQPGRRSGKRQLITVSARKRPGQKEWSIETDGLFSPRSAASRPPRRTPVEATGATHFGNRCYPLRGSQTFSKSGLTPPVLLVRLRQNGQGSQRGRFSLRPPRPRRELFPIHSAGRKKQSVFANAAITSNHEIAGVNSRILCEKSGLSARAAQKAQPGDGLKLQRRIEPPRAPRAPSLVLRIDGNSCHNQQC